MFDKFGVEIEGGWETTPYGFCHDGSVRAPARIVGESVSPAYRRASTVVKFIADNWPTEVNESCGFHIHLSTQSNGLYSRLMSEDFCQKTLNFWRDWGTRNNVKSSHRFWNRLSGANSYCRIETPEFMIQSRARSKSGERYRFLNFCHMLHGTMELRLLPAWKDAAMAQKSFQDWIDFVERYLSAPDTTGRHVEEIVWTGNLEPLVITDTSFSPRTTGTGRTFTRAEHGEWIAYLAQHGRGLRIHARGRFDGREIDCTGTVCDIDNDDEAGVAFDRNISGHNCNGHCSEYGNGWYIHTWDAGATVTII